MTPITKYLSFDGQEFADPDACRRHESENFAMRLIGLTAEQVAAALSRDDPDLGDAIEKAGRVIAERRKADGVYKRARNGEAGKSAAPEPLKITHEPAVDRDEVPSDGDGEASEPAACDAEAVES